jgi:hypothetical protein
MYTYFPLYTAQDEVKTSQVQGRRRGTIQTHQAKVYSRFELLI